MNDDARNLTFYRSVVGDGIYCVVGLMKGQGPIQKFCSSLPALLATVEQVKALRRDTYFNVSGLLKQGNRKAHNVLSHRSVFVDLDCGPDKPFADQKAATLALMSVVRSGGLPAPSWVVNSGGGIHAYWCADDTTTPDEWQEVANALRDRCAALGLHIDTACTIDRARIMRAPGTFNYKLAATPRPARIVAPAEGRAHKVYSWDDLRAAFNVSLRGATAALGAVSDVFGAPNADDWDIPMPTRTRQGYLLENLQHHCKFVADAAETRGRHLDEPAWFRSLGLAAYCEDGEEWALGKLSDGHANFTESETRQKFERAFEEANKPGANYGPPTCKTISTVSPSCTTCPNRSAWMGRKGYPWHAASLPLVAPDEGKGLTLPSGWLPQGFKRLASNEIVALVQKETENSDGQPMLFTDEVPFAMDLPVNFRLVVRERRHRDDIVPIFLPHIRYDSESSPNGTVVLDAAALTTGSDTGLESAFRRGGAFIRKGGFGHMRKLMLEIYEAIEANRRKFGVSYADATAQDKLGFSPDSTAFSVGGRTYKKGQREPTVPYIPIERATDNKQAKAALEQRGTEAGSYAAISRLMKGAHPIMSLALAVSLASPLLPRTNVKGFLLHLTSLATGSGKTTTLMGAAALWGPIEHLFLGSNSSVLAWQHSMADRSPLPAFIDEMRFRDSTNPAKSLPGAFGPEEVKGLTEGRSGVKLKMTGETREEKHWQCFTLSSSNHSLSTILSDSDPAVRAVLARTMEIDVSNYTTKALHLDMALDKGLRENVGWLGPKFMQVILDHYPPAVIEAGLERMTNIILKRLGHTAMPPALRFRIPALSVAMLAASIAAKHNILPFDIPAMMRALIEALAAFERVEVREEESHQGRDANVYATLLDYAMSKPGTHTLTCDGYMTQAPTQGTQESNVHYDLTERVVYMRIGPLREALARTAPSIARMRFAGLEDISSREKVHMGQRRKIFGKPCGVEDDYGPLLVFVAIPDALHARLMKTMTPLGSMPA